NLIVGPRDIVTGRVHLQVVRVHPLVLEPLLHPCPRPPFVPDPVLQDGEDRGVDRQAVAAVAGVLENAALADRVRLVPRSFRIRMPSPLKSVILNPLMVTPPATPGFRWESSLTSDLTGFQHIRTSSSILHAGPLTAGGGGTDGGPRAVIS